MLLVAVDDEVSLVEGVVSYSFGVRSSSETSSSASGAATVGGSFRGLSSSATAGAGAGAAVKPGKGETIDGLNPVGAGAGAAGTGAGAAGVPRGVFPLEGAGTLPFELFVNDVFDPAPCAAGAGDDDTSGTAGTVGKTDGAGEGVAEEFEAPEVLLEDTGAGVGEDAFDDTPGTAGMLGTTEMFELFELFSVGFEVSLFSTAFFDSGEGVGAGA